MTYTVLEDTVFNVVAKLHPSNVTVWKVPPGWKSLQWTKPDVD